MLSIVAGCQTDAGGGASAQRGAQVSARKTYLIHLPGIAGDSVFDRWWMNALNEGGLGAQAELFDWTARDRWFAALHARQRNQREAQRLAERITQISRNEPSAQVIITAQSGGTGVLVWALERLPDDVRVRSALLVAPAISPCYDLSAALRHVDHRMYAFVSAGDFFILGAGTSVFGTMDGANAEAAGRFGFRAPRAAEQAQYAKLKNVDYDPAWLWYGNFGDHTGAMSLTFARYVLAPLLNAGLEGPASVSASSRADQRASVQNHPTTRAANSVRSSVGG